MVCAMTDTLIWIAGVADDLGAALAATVPFDGAHVTEVSESAGAPSTEHLPADLADPTSWAAVEAHLTARLGSFEGTRAVFVHVAAPMEDAGSSTPGDSHAHRRHVLLRSAAPQALGHAFLAATRGFSGRSHLIILTAADAVELWVRTAGKEQTSRTNPTTVIAVDPGTQGVEEPEAAARAIWSLQDRDLATGAVVDLHTLDGQ
jgi:benzil reductase ((S)-benzoin forming)